MIGSHNIANLDSFQWTSGKVLSPILMKLNPDLNTQEFDIYLMFCQQHDFLFSLCLLCFTDNCLDTTQRTVKLIQRKDLGHRPSRWYGQRSTVILAKLKHLLEKLCFVHAFFHVPPPKEGSTPPPLEIWTNRKPEQHHNYPMAVFQVPNDIVQSSIMFYHVNPESYDRAAKTDLMTTLTSVCCETWVRSARKTRGRTKDAVASRWSA
jgi:hypothetical protein